MDFQANGWLDKERFPDCPQKVYSFNEWKEFMASQPKDEGAFPPEVDVSALLHLRGQPVKIIRELLDKSLVFLSIARKQRILEILSSEESFECQIDTLNIYFMGEICSMMKPNRPHRMFDILDHIEPVPISTTIAAQISEIQKKHEDDISTILCNNNLKDLHGNLKYLHDDSTSSSLIPAMLTQYYQWLRYPSINDRCGKHMDPVKTWRYLHLLHPVDTFYIHAERIEQTFVDALYRIFDNLTTEQCLSIVKANPFLAHYWEIKYD